jgi:hypothetical protein
LAIDGDKQVSHRIYSRTSLPRTPLDWKILSIIKRCPDYRGQIE